MGDVVGMVLRWDTPHGKDIRPVARVGDGWIIGGMPKPRPLLNLPELQGRPDERVYVTEGEPAADAIRSLGLLVTTSAGGSAAPRMTDWSALRGRRIVLLPDADDAGCKYATEVVRILAALQPRPEVRVVELPGLPPKGDAVQFVGARDGRPRDGIIAELDNLIAAVEPVVFEPVIHGTAPVLRRLSDVRPEPVQWLWPGRVARGKLTLLVGDPGLGKSFLTLDMAARVSRGTLWPDGTTGCSGDVVLLSAEDDLADTIRPRLDAAGADVARIVALQAVRTPAPDTGGTRDVPFNLSADLVALEATVAEVGECKLIIIDPISAYMGGGPRFDSHRNTDVRAVLGPLADLAGRHRVAVVAVTHLRKSDGPALYRAMGSLAFVAAARAAWAVVQDKDDATNRRRLFLPVKSNLAAEATGLAFQVEPRTPGEAPCVAWDPEPVTVSADEALAGRPTKGGGGAVEEAVAWLEDALAEGPEPAADIKARSRADGISPRTLDRAKAELNVVAAPDGFRGPWVWRLPKEGPAAQSAPTAPEYAKLNALAHSEDLGALWPPDEADSSSGGSDQTGCPAGEQTPAAVLASYPEADEGWGEL
jgi:hypothetical protein